MSFTAAIDIATFIWCEQDFNENKNQYISLKSLVPEIYTQIKELKLPILFCDNLQQLIWTDFPYKMIEEKEIGYDFQRLTWEFFTDTFSNWALYTENNDKTITSVPILKKPHFSDNIQTETQSQVCHLFYNGQNPEHKFIAYNYFFNQDVNLVLNRQNESVKIDTLRYSTAKDIIQFFEKFRLKFEHNPKHTRKIRYSDGEKISPFTCYHQPGGEIKAKALFEKAIFHEGYFYNFDLDNDVYVRFLKTHVDRPIYHGHDLSDENEDVPNRVRKKFNKHGRVF